MPGWCIYLSGVVFSFAAAVKRSHEGGLAVNLVDILFSPERRAARLEKDLQAALLAKDQEKATSVFCRSFLLMLQKEKARLLADLVLSYAPQIGSAIALVKHIPSTELRQAIRLLEERHLDSAALVLCDCAGHDAKAIEILARRGRASELAMRMAKDNMIDRELLETAVASWEEYNGDIRSSPAMSHMLISVATFAPEGIPDNPRARQIAGQFEEAAALYIKGGDLSSAALCYEEAGMYGEAFTIHESLGDNERASRAAEALGDLEKALELVVSPERKFRLLLRTERFLEAREFAIGLEDPGKYFELIKEQAGRRMEVRVKGHDFIAALELAEFAECEPAEREEIVMLGRQRFDRQIASAQSQEEITSIYQERVRLEEKAGHFVEAGELAERVLGDLERASFLYEKAGLFDRAIGAISAHPAGSADRDAANIRLAELHEKGGSLLKAASVYEAIGLYDKAFRLYEDSEHFNKAIECYLKTSSPNQSVLVRLYTSAGEFERVVEIYMDSGEFADLEEALSIATIHKLSSHIKVIKERMADFELGSAQDLERCFTRARDEVVGTYSSVIGIDFGTTNSVVAIFNKTSQKVEIIPNPQGSAIEPSFFGVDESNHPIFGEAARLRALTAPDNVVARFKRSLGEQTSITIGGKHYRCEEIVASFLQHLRSNAETYVQSKVEARLYDLLESENLRFSAEKVKKFLKQQNTYIHFQDVVLSVPAYFNDNQKRATRDSAEIAGLCVRRLMHEPTAAALAYCSQKPYEGRLAVIDLGGGTLDISIVDVGEGVTDVQSVGGDTKLGGSDIDAILVQHVAQNVRRFFGIDVSEEAHPVEIARLRHACENLKINLSSITQDSMELRHFLNKPVFAFTMTRTELERLSRQVLDRIKLTIEKTIADYGARIDNFLLVGNATKMPAIGVLAKRTIPAKQLAGIDPGTVVATGAALQGSILAGERTQLLVLDVVPYSLGIAAFHGQDEEEVISRVIEKNSRIPVARSSIYSTKRDNQTSAHIRIYQGESPEPFKNHFLGDFELKGIPPAPAGTPQIEVTFDIGTDCILTVTAVDKGTGKQRSFQVERAVVLSPQEKQRLGQYFVEREQLHSFERDLESARREVDALRSLCAEAIRTADGSIRDFFEKFHEKVEVNPTLYRVNPDQIQEIQEMIIQKDQFVHGIPQYNDQFTSILASLERIETRHLDFSASDIVAKLKERIDALSHYKQALRDLLESVEKATSIVANWIQILESMEPDSERMSPLEAANYHLTAGRAGKARATLEALASSPEGLTEEAFCLLLECYDSLGLSEEYRDLHNRFGRLFGMIHVDLAHLNSYLKAVADSVFMIQGVSGPPGPTHGSGFCFAPNLIATNRHVIQGMSRSQIRIIGRSATYRVDRLELDPKNDLAILRVGENLKPLRLGVFDFVEPGQQVLAIGFPHPSSDSHSENIYISKGIVNSIRTMEGLSERVVFIDAKIGRGMSGGPLINDLGEVIGIITLAMYWRMEGEQRHLPMEDQPVALPIHLLKKHLPGIH